MNEIKTTTISNTLAFKQHITAQGCLKFRTEELIPFQFMRLNLNRIGHNLQVVELEAELNDSKRN